MRIIAKFWMVLCLCVFGADLHSRGFAGEIQATEVMMESQGLQAILLGQYLGPDNASPLSFTSQVDSQGLSFQYSVAAGSTYQGMPVSWNTTGSFDSSTGLWAWTTTSSVGSLNLDLTGGGGPFAGGDPPYFGNLGLTLDIHLPKTVVSDVTYTQTATRTVSEGTITVKDDLGNVLSSGKHTDQLILQGPDAGMWMWDTGLLTSALGKGDFQVLANGLTPQPGGGAGAFTLTIASVPEPSTLVLAGIAATLGMGMGVFRGRIRLRGRSTNPGQVVRELA